MWETPQLTFPCFCHYLANWHCLWLLGCTGIYTPSQNLLSSSLCLSTCHLFTLIVICSGHWVCYDDVWWIWTLRWTGEHWWLTGRYQTHIWASKLVLVSGTLALVNRLHWTNATILCHHFSHNTLSSSPTCHGQRNSVVGGLWSI